MYRSQKFNRLASETSPYLLQHARNPVDWYPWGKEALAKARHENKPILLSIGYSSCHWCHVMAHESFEDQETANLMNKLFVNIKVDREERPDLDKVYQTAHYFLTQRGGGWPLTIFLTPGDLAPFFSGTYFPKEARHKLPAFHDVLKAISATYYNQSADIKKQNSELVKALQRDELSITNTLLNNQPCQLALNLLQQHYNSTYGGFCGAPKFPQPTILEFLLDNNSTMALDTLKHMMNGGIYDHLAGGFFRYSIDEKWLIPHFEKMLYDNGQLLFIYALAAKQYQEEIFANLTRKTAEWVQNTMQALTGGYFSSLDADSEKKEGQFYAWDLAEIQSILNQDEYAVAQLYFGLINPANFEHQWHLHIAQPPKSIADTLNISLDKVQSLLTIAQQKMLAERNKRTHPNRDTKVLTAWNSLMIKGMLTAGSLLEAPEFIASAQRAIMFIQHDLWHNQRLMACTKDGRASITGFLDDYVFLIDALLTSLQITWQSEHLLFATKLADAVLTHFYDSANGGFFFTANDQEKLLYRPKTLTDEAMPSGNGVAVRIFLILGYLLGESRYLDAAEKTLQAASSSISQFPISHCSLLLGLKDYLDPPPIIIIRGTANEWSSWQTKCQSSRNLVFAIPNDAENLPDALSSKKPLGKICAYICQGMQCSAVIEDINQLKV